MQRVPPARGGQTALKALMKDFSGVRSRPSAVVAGRMLPVKTGDEMRLLRGDRRQMPRRHEAEPEQRLLVFPVERKNLHQQTLKVLEHAFGCF